MLHGAVEPLLRLPGATSTRSWPFMPPVKRKTTVVFAAPSMLMPPVKVLLAELPRSSVPAFRSMPPVLERALGRVTRPLPFFVIEPVPPMPLPLKV